MSITLTSAATAVFNGVTEETDANAAVTYVELAYPNSLRIFITFGNTSGETFTPGSVLPKVIITVSLITGTWTTTTGLSGTLSGAALTSAQTVALNLQNALETFAVNNSIVVGTEVAWTIGEL